MKRTWWKESIVYQIYPRSFNDSNGDGIGDLRGIIQKLDYLKELGINVIWLSPVYQSPNDDNGYDISDYQAIMAEFGTLDDWDELIREMHARDIKLVMDLVVNHTSDEHHWFQQSRQSKDNPYRDYYIWRPGQNGREPNNWLSHFSGSAWQHDPATDEYYLHLFSKKQPDLNWENPQVRAEVYEMMHWWLKRGVDGFRMDVINMISKVPGLPDVPVSDGSRYVYGGEFFLNGPRLLEFLDEMKQHVLSHYDILTVGETPGVTPEYAVKLTDEEAGALTMVFQFEHMDLDPKPNPSRLTREPWRLTALKQVMTRWQKGLETQGWNSIYLSNHDQPRALSRFGNDKQYRVESAKLLATLTHTLQGTPYIYQGEEIGMTNVAFATIAEYQDIETVNMYRELVEERELDPATIMPLFHATSRDNARTPVQWDDSPQAGFTTGRPWLGVNPNYPHINVQQALADPNSIFYYYQRLIQLRRQNPILVYGTYELLLAEDEQIYAYTRSYEEERVLVILNFSVDQPVFALPEHISYRRAELMISNYEGDAAADLRHLPLRPYEARVYWLK